MPQTGLVCIEQYDTGVELCIEDIDDLIKFVEELGRDKIANREDFQ